MWVQISNRELPNYCPLGRDILTTTQQNKKYEYAGPKETDNNCLRCIPIRAKEELYDTVTLDTMEEFY